MAQNNKIFVRAEDLRAGDLIYVDGGIGDRKRKGIRFHQVLNVYPVHSQFPCDVSSDLIAVHMKNNAHGFKTIRTFSKEEVLTLVKFAVDES